MTVPPHEFADPAPIGVTIFLGIFLILLLIVLIPVLILLFARRNHKMLVPRSIPTLLLLLVVQYSAAVVFAVSLILGKPPFCSTLDAFYLLIPVVGVHFNLNIPNLVFQDEINSLKVSIAQSGSASWVERVMKAFSFRFRILYLFIIALVVVGIYLIVHYVGVLPGHLPGDCNRASQLTYTIVLLTILIILFYFLVKVSKVRDPYYLRLENNIGSVLLLPIMVLNIIYPIAPQIFPESFEYRWVVILMPFCSILGNGLLPVLLTFPSFLRWLQSLTGDLITTEDQKELDTKGTIFALSRGVDVFQAVLNDPDLCEAFTQFTVSQWCVENVLFYKAVDDFKAKYKQNPTEAIQVARFIAREYITAGSPLEVNLDFSVKRVILREIEESLSESTFEQAQRSIYTLMENDSFAQWQRTGDFKRALEKVVEARNSSKGSAERISKARSHGHTDSPNRTREEKTQSQVYSQVPMTSTDSEELKVVQIEMSSEGR